MAVTPLSFALTVCSTSRFRPRLPERERAQTSNGVTHRDTTRPNTHLHGGVANSPKGTRYHAAASIMFKVKGHQPLSTDAGTLQRRSLIYLHYYLLGNSASSMPVLRAKGGVKYLVAANNQIYCFLAMEQRSMSTLLLARIGHSCFIASTILRVLGELSVLSWSSRNKLGRLRLSTLLESHGPYQHCSYKFTYTLQSGSVEGRSTA